jgi:hypothetical protein
VLGAATSFNGFGSADPDAAIVRYDWSFGDGTSAANAGATPSHTVALVATRLR